MKVGGTASARMERSKVYSPVSGKRIAVNCDGDILIVLLCSQLRTSSRRKRQCKMKEECMSLDRNGYAKASIITSGT